MAGCEARSTSGRWRRCPRHVRLALCEGRGESQDGHGLTQPIDAPHETGQANPRERRLDRPRIPPHRRPPLVRPGDVEAHLWQRQQRDQGGQGRDVRPPPSLSLARSVTAIPATPSRSSRGCRTAVADLVFRSLGALQHPDDLGHGREPLWRRVPVALLRAVAGEEQGGEEDLRLEPDMGCVSRSFFPVWRAQTDFFWSGRHPQRTTRPSSTASA